MCGFIFHGHACDTQSRIMFSFNENLHHLQKYSCGDNNKYFQGIFIGHRVFPFNLKLLLIVIGIFNFILLFNELYLVNIIGKYPVQKRGHTYLFIHNLLFCLKESEQMFKIM